MLILLRSLLKNKTRSKIFNLSYLISLSCISAVTCVVLGENKIFVVASNYLLAFPFYVSHMVRKAAQRFSRISSIQSQSLFTFFYSFSVYSFFLHADPFFYCKEWAGSFLYVSFNYSFKKALKFGLFFIFF